ncbi:hypothetical protein [Flavipsychrobacter stenotrophus]|nr:hypothetical protein [Flavipsychrobacter stenotrophus]
MKTLITLCAFLFFIPNAYTQAKPIVCISFLNENFCCDKPPMAIHIKRSSQLLDDSCRCLGWATNQPTYSVSDKMFTCIEHFVTANMDTIYHRADLSRGVPFQIAVNMWTKEQLLRYSFLQKGEIGHYFNKLKQTLRADKTLTDKKEVKKIVDAIDGIPFVRDR